MTRYALILLAAASTAAQDVPREEALRALRKAVRFYNEKVSPHGAYHFAYTQDLSYGRSESADSPTRPEVQREGTPSVGDAFLRAWDATRDRYYLEAARRVAHAYVAGQLCSGGWDYTIEFDPAKRKQFAYRAGNNCGGSGVTNLDDNVTQSAMRFLMRVDRELNFEDKQVHEAALYALDRLMKAQYPIGAWPQRYRDFPDPAKFPLKRASYPASWPTKWPGSNYQAHYTFNDNSIIDMIDTMLEAARIYNDPRYLASAEKGGEFILLAQMPDPQPAWAQQYDANMHPAWARIFEPPSVTGGESQGIMRILLVLYSETGNRKYLEPLPRALDYLKKSVLKPEQIPDRTRNLVPEAAIGAGDLGNWRRDGGTMLARFYELQSNRPLYVTKGTRVSVKGEGTKLIDGYEISYSPASVITHYGVVTSGDQLPAIEADYKRVSAAAPSSLRRPDKLRGLSPWSERVSRSRRAAASSVKVVVAGMDDRGAWVEDGVIGKPDRLIQVFAAKDMVLTVGGRPLPLKENATLEVFQGPQPPRERIIRTRTFHANVTLLCDYLVGLGL
jgi:hypothetical protein